MSSFADTMLVSGLAPSPNPPASGVHTLQARPGQVGQGDDGDDGDDGDLILPIVFTGDDVANGLRRGVTVPEILAGAGKHWEPNSLLSEQSKSWVLSVPVRRNLAFISHAWNASRLIKWLALLAFFNGSWAAVASVIAAIAAVFVDHYGGAELLRFEAPVMWQHYTSTCTAFPFVAGVIAGAVVFFTGHHIRRAFEAAHVLSPQHVFLDKLVIHQDDPDLKVQGIRLLGAFIRTSDVFLVLLNKDYLTRLWCSYEVAVFAHLKRATDAQVQPCLWPLPLVKIAAAKVTQTISVGVVQFAVMFKVVPANAEWMQTMFMGLFWIIPDVALVAGMCELQYEAGAMQEQVGSYDLRNTGCFDPSDRQHVEAAVAAWFDPSNRSQAIDHFNDFVRTDIRHLVSESFGDGGKIHASVALWAALPGPFFDVMAYVAHGKQPLLIHAGWCFTSMVRNVPFMMCVVAFQFRIVRCVRRCLQGDYNYASLAEHDQAAMYLRGSFVLQVIFCTLFDFVAVLTFAECAQAPLVISLPLHVCVIVLAIYLYK